MNTDKKQNAADEGRGIPIPLPPPPLGTLGCYGSTM